VKTKPLSCHTLQLLSRDHALFEVDILPSQPQCLTPSHPVISISMNRLPKVASSRLFIRRFAWAAVTLREDESDEVLVDDVAVIDGGGLNGGRPRRLCASGRAAVRRLPTCRSGGPWAASRSCSSKRRLSPCRARPPSFSRSPSCASTVPVRHAQRWRQTRGRRRFRR